MSSQSKGSTAPEPLQSVEQLVARLQGLVQRARARAPEISKAECASQFLELVEAQDQMIRVMLADRAKLRARLDHSSVPVAEQGSQLDAGDIAFLRSVGINPTHRPRTRRSARRAARSAN